MKRFILMCILNLSINANAQSSLLLEGCNSLTDANKRLVCLQEFMQKSSENPSVKYRNNLSDLRRSYSSISGAVSSGLSLASYRNISGEPAKALAVFQAENPDASPEALRLLQTAASAYRDAEQVWQASIFKSQDAGFAGQVLNWRAVGLEEIVNRYSLFTTTVLFNDHLPAEAALQKIWRTALDASTSAFKLLDNPSAQSAN